MYTKNAKLITLITIFLLSINLIYAVDTDKLNTNTIAYYTLQDNADDSTGNYNLTLISSPPSTTSGKIGESYDFDGTADYINGDVLAGNLGTTTGSLSMWFYFDTVASAIPISSGRSSSNNDFMVGLQLYDSGGGDFRAYASAKIGGSTTGAFYGNTTLSASTWYHYVLTTDGSNWKQYLNGQEQSLTITSGANTGDWFDDPAAIDEFTIMALRRSAGTPSSFTDGVVDEIIFFNHTLNQSEVNYFYQSGTPTSDQQYLYPTSSTATEVTISAKDWINDYTINSTTIYINGIMYNTTNGTINTGHYDNETTLYNLTFNTTGYDVRTYTNRNWSNGNIEGILTLSQNIFVNFYAKDEDDESLTNVYYNITTSTTNQENLGNPTQINLLNFINETSTTLNITINIEDRGNLYQDKTTTYIINRTTREVNTSLDPNELVLYFYDKDGNPTSVYGELTNEGYSANFTDDNFTFVQQNLSIGYVYIKLTTNSSKPFTQFYEYYNDYSNHIIQNITILTENTLTNFSIKVIGNTQNPLKEALVEANIVNPLGIYMSENLFIGQRYTDANGYTNLYMGNKDISFDVSKDGYTTKVTKTYSPVDMIPYLTNNPLEIALSGGGITQTRGLTIIIPQYTKNKSIDIPIYIHSPISTDIEVRTTYMINNGITKRGLSETTNNDIYYTLLESGTHFDSGTGDITIEIYKDDTNHSTHTIIDKSTETTTNLFEKPTGIDTDVLLIILIIGIILASGFIGTQFDYEDAGIFGFYALSLIFVLIDNTFIWVITIPAIIMIAKKLMGLGGVSE